MKMTKAQKIIIPIASVSLMLVILLLSVISVFAVTNAVVISKGNDIEEDFSGKEYDCILVLGAGVHADGTPSDMLEDRLKVAIELYKKGVSTTLVLSGDYDEAEDYDEVTAMANYCISNGVPDSAIVRDTKGFSTYESIDNLKKAEKYGTAVVVTQRYHLYRALYIAEKMEIDAVGADASLRTYRGQLYRDFREVAARTKDFFMVALKG